MAEFHLKITTDDTDSFSTADEFTVTAHLEDIRSHKDAETITEVLESFTR